MSLGLLIAGGGLTTAAVIGIAYRRRREHMRLREWAHRHNWSVSLDNPKDLLWRIRNTALTQFGHSRRISHALTTEGRMHLLTYVCETGFEHRRQSHRWHVVLCESEHQAGRATITAEDWLMIAARCPAGRELTLSDYSSTSSDPSMASQSCRVIVEHPGEWEPALQGGLADWFLRQPRKRNWEIVPGFIVGYEPRTTHDEAVVDLVKAAEDLAGRISS